MKRITKLEKKYLLESLSNEFRTSKLGAFNKKLNLEFAKQVKSKFALSLSSGTAGLHVALKALGIDKKKFEVIIPSITMSATAMAVINAGATPIFADIDEKTLNISAESIKKKISKQTKAIITVSLYGLAPNYKKIKKIINKKKIFLIEDNAECFLGKINNKIVGNFGDFSVFSFQSSKHLTCGEGGIITTNQKKLFDSAAKVANLGYKNLKINYQKKRIRLEDPNFDRHITIGLNYRLSELNAAVALAQTKRMKELTNLRKMIGKKFLNITKQFKIFKYQEVQKGYEHAYWAFVIILPDQISIKEFSKMYKKNGGDYFYAAWKLPYMEPFYKKKVIENRVAKKIQKNIVALKTNYFSKIDVNNQLNALKKTLNFLSNKYKKNDGI